MSVFDVRLEPDQLERLAELIAARIALPAQRLVTVGEVAEFLGVKRSWVYEHAAELGVRRLGPGPKAPLRFSLAEVEQRLKLSTLDEPLQRRRRVRSLGRNVPLLPVRGERE